MDHPAVSFLPATPADLSLARLVGASQEAVKFQEYLLDLENTWQNAEADGDFVLQARCALIRARLNPDALPGLNLQKRTNYPILGRDFYSQYHSFERQVLPAILALPDLDEKIVALLRHAELPATEFLATQALRELLTAVPDPVERLGRLANLLRSREWEYLGELLLLFAACLDEIPAGAAWNAAFSDLAASLPARTARLASIVTQYEAAFQPRLCVAALRLCQELLETVKRAGNMTADDWLILEGAQTWLRRLWDSPAWGVEARNTLRDIAARTGSEPPMRFLAFTSPAIAMDWVAGEIQRSDHEPPGPEIAVYLGELFPLATPSLARSMIAILGGCQSNSLRILGAAAWLRWENTHHFTDNREVEKAHYLLVLENLGRLDPVLLPLVLSWLEIGLAPWVKMSKYGPSGLQKALRSIAFQPFPVCLFCLESLVPIIAGIGMQKAQRQALQAGLQQVIDEIAAWQFPVLSLEMIDLLEPAAVKQISAEKAPPSSQVGNARRPLPTKVPEPLRCPRCQGVRFWHTWNRRFLTCLDCLPPGPNDQDQATVVDLGQEASSLPLNPCLVIREADVAFFRRLGFFYEYTGLPDARLVEDLREKSARYDPPAVTAYDVFGDFVDVPAPLQDLYLVAWDFQRTWFSSRERDFPLYPDILLKWGAISQGAFNPQKIEEAGGPLEGCILEVRFELDGVPRLLKPHDYGDHIDPQVLNAVNRWIAHKHVRLVYWVFDEVMLVIALTPDEERSLVYERGWRLP